MIGATVLSCTAMYFLFTNQKEVLKKKITSLNNALTGLQTERSILKIKADNLYMENITQSKEIDNMQKVIGEQQNIIVRLENDNRLLIKEYLFLENQIQNA